MFPPLSAFRVGVVAVLFAAQPSLALDSWGLFTSPRRAKLMLRRRSIPG